MAKIYNEIVIDMNPESPSFEEVLHEDSYEYEGEMMLMTWSNWDIIGYDENGTEWRVRYNVQAGNRPVNAQVSKGGTMVGNKKMSSATSRDNYAEWIKLTTQAGNAGKSLHSEWPPPPEEPDEGTVDTDASIGERGFGQERLTAQDFQGKTEADAIDFIWKTKYNQTVPDGGDAEEFKKQIGEKLKEFGPQIGTIPEEELAFAREEKERDIYSLSEFAPQVGQMMRGVTGGGMGAGLRGGISTEKKIGTKFADIQADYGKDIYGLQKTQEEAWESDFKTFIGSLPAAEGTT